MKKYIKPQSEIHRIESYDVFMSLSVFDDSADDSEVLVKEESVEWKNKVSWDESDLW